MIPEPMNVEEKYLHAIVVRLDAIAHMLSSFMEVYAEKEHVATTSHKVVEQVESKPRKRKAKE